MRKLKLTIEYDGTPFLGWQKQEHGASVQQTLEDAFFKMTGEKIETFASGRTDKGVHALGQVCHFDTESDLPLIRFKDGLNHHMRPHVSVLNVEEVDDDFHARFSATMRSYRYTLFNRRENSPIWRHRAHLVRKPLDEKKMNAALKNFKGEIDCNAFRSSECQSNVSMVNVKKTQVTRDGQLIHFDITANHFLHNMIRILMGTLIEIGTGDRPVNSIDQLLKSLDRTEAGPTIKPDGLYFVSVDY